MGLRKFQQTFFKSLKKIKNMTIQGVNDRNDPRAQN